MKNIKLFFMMSLVLMMAGSCRHSKNFGYPETRRVDTVDEYFGVKIADPYRWLENDTSAETAAWVKAQNEFTQKYLSRIPFRKALKDYYTNIWNFPKYGVPFSKKKPVFLFQKRWHAKSKCPLCAGRPAGRAEGFARS
jgi:prolyl oligopeptidase